MTFQIFIKTKVLEIINNFLGCLVCCAFLCFVTFAYGVLGQVKYLIVSIPDLCLPLYIVFQTPRCCDYHANMIGYNANNMPFNT